MGAIFLQTDSTHIAIIYKYLRNTLEVLIQMNLYKSFRSSRKFPESFVKLSEVSENLKNTASLKMFLEVLSRLRIHLLDSKKSIASFKAFHESFVFTTSEASASKCF